MGSAETGTVAYAERCPFAPLPCQASSRAKAAEPKPEQEPGEQLRSEAPFPGGSFFPCPSADLPHS